MPVPAAAVQLGVQLFQQQQAQQEAEEARASTFLPMQPRYHQPPQMPGLLDPWMPKPFALAPALFGQAPPEPPPGLMPMQMNLGMGPGVGAGYGAGQGLGLMQSLAAEPPMMGLMREPPALPAAEEPIKPALGLFADALKGRDPAAAGAPPPLMPSPGLGGLAPDSLLQRYASAGLAPSRLRSIGARLQGGAGGTQQRAGAGVPARGLRGAPGRLGGLADLLVAGEDDPRLSDEANRSARRAAYVQAGLQVLLDQEPHYGPPRSVLGSLARGAMAGQEVAAGVRGGAVEREQQTRAADEQKRIGAIIGTTPRAQWPQLIQSLIGAGRREDAEAVRKLMEADPLPGEPKVTIERETPNGTTYRAEGTAGQVQPLVDNWPQGRAEPDPTAWIKGANDRMFPNTPEGRQAALAWEQQVANARHIAEAAGLKPEAYLSFVSRYEADPIIRDAGQVAQAIQRIRGLAAGPSSPAADTALLYAHIKLLDPGSAVREGEMATAGNAGNIPDRLRTAYNLLVRGEGRLSDEMRAEFVNASETIAEGQREMVRTSMGRWRETARLMGAPESLVYDPFEAVSTPSNDMRGQPISVRRERDPHYVESSLDVLAPEVRSATERLLEAARQEGIRLTVRETGRSEARQRYLFEQGPSTTRTLKSNHLDGRAVDFDAADDRARRWYRRNAPRFGFRLLGDWDPTHGEMPARANPPTTIRGVRESRQRGGNRQ